MKIIEATKKYKEQDGLFRILFSVIDVIIKPSNNFKTFTSKEIDKNFVCKMLVIAETLAKKYNVDIDFEIRKGYPFLENDVPLTEKAIEWAKQYLGEENVALLPIRMTAEDFSYYSQKVPSCF